MKREFKTIFFSNKPVIKSTYSVVGPKEFAGPIGKSFDYAINEDRFGESTYEKAECKILSTAIRGVIKKQNLFDKEIDLLLAGDLLNQIISASYSARDFEIPFFGLYNACATIVEALTLGATFLDGGYINNSVCATVSHFATAERQYRYPLELGSTRPPQSQWTVTGSGAYLLTPFESGYPSITNATIGKVVDFGVTDANNMGAAMAPSACSTISRHFKGTKTKPTDYDLIITGDLGALGSRILKKLLKDEGFDIDANHVDCGELIYNIDEKVYQGGSGAGCLAVVFASYLYPKILKQKINKVLLVATGALLSTVSAGQGESIPGVSHAITVENLYD